MSCLHASTPAAYGRVQGENIGRVKQDESGREKENELFFFKVERTLVFSSCRFLPTTRKQWAYQIWRCGGNDGKDWVTLRASCSVLSPSFLEVSLTSKSTASISRHIEENVLSFSYSPSLLFALSLSGALPARNDATLLARLAESRITFPYTKSRLVLAKKMKIKRGGYLHSRWNEAARYIGCCDRRRDVPPSISNVAAGAIHKQPLGKSPNWISFRHTMEVWLQRGGRERYFLLSVFIISRRTELAIFWPRGSSTQTMEKLEIRVARH